MNFMARKLRAYSLRKARYTFKVDFSNATLSTPMTTSDGYEILVGNYSIQCKGITIAENLSGSIQFNQAELMDSDAESQFYEEQYEKLITIPDKQFDKDHENDSDEDYIRLREEFDRELSRLNLELDESFENIQYELLSAGKIPSVSFKGSYDEYEGADLDDEYIDELHLTLSARMTVNGQSKEYKVKTEYASFVPSDDAIMEMTSYMESESTE